MQIEKIELVINIIHTNTEMHLKTWRYNELKEVASFFVKRC